ncbi:hypothetical protein CALCODRAFT_518103 [Calocera cornea HHB12733]|uniref:Rad21/Rec8-like protein N-terminal domain-containing protein n=1 Tax=Calocera cornea HHB12733 TaxID=1353952 RepID=A0A165F9R6_9BASI|nr:hypothetical protein CALCODRAFT_518103 [Calocera cornea HHB12733]
MFFTPELLQRRDSGFGLIWLAATLGSKSALRKLPRKGILSADIPQLCEMISSPPEPLALRLSANLMVGVIRVYHARHDIWAADVTHTFTNLKKAVNAMYAESGAITLEMVQSTVKPDAITLPAAGERTGIDFNFDFALNFASMSKEWGAELGVISPAVNRRSDPRDITLDESHLLEGADPLSVRDYDFSFDFVPGAGGDPSSSSVAPRSSRTGAGHATSSSGNVPFNMDFDLGLDGGAVGEDGRIDLGLGLEDDGWGGQGWGDANGGQDGQIDLGLYGNDLQGLDGPPGTPSDHLSSAIRKDLAAGHRRKANNLGNLVMVDDDGQPRHERTPSLTHSQESPPSADNLDDLPPGGKRPGEELEGAKKKKKRVRLLLDARTELTDAELVANREGYMETMLAARAEQKSKAAKSWVIALLEKDIPDGYDAPELRDCFVNVIEMNQEARKRRWAEESFEEERAVRRRIDGVQEVEDGRGMVVFPDDELMMDMDLRGEGGWGQAQGWGENGMDGMNPDGDIPQMRTPKSILRQSISSVEQARGASILHDISQKSNSFPWDNVDIDGHPSSSSWAPFSMGGARSSDGPRSGFSPSAEINAADMRVRQGSREGSLIPSDLGSTPKRSIGGPDGPIEDFPGFNETAQIQTQSQTQSQSQDPDSLATLERNSFNFLELPLCRYIKAEHNVAQRGLPAGVGSAKVTLDGVLPAYAKSRHVAANAFYNCLVLATKSFIQLDQPVPYGDINIQII